MCAHFTQAPALVNKKVGGLPLITLFGSITLAYLLWMVYASYAYPAVGGYVSPSVVGLFLGVVVVGVILFYSAKYVRTKQGLDLKFIYDSIPPE